VTGAAAGRKPRVHFPGALYHVIARGNQRQAIFPYDADRRRWLGKSDSMYDELTLAELERW